MAEGQNSGLTAPVNAQTELKPAVQPGEPWTISGDNIYNNNSGNVGIGTTTPAATLDIFSTSATSLNIVNNNGGYGVYAQGNGTEIVGTTSATTASKYGVAGFNTGTTGSNAGVLGTAASGNGYGVYGVNNASGGIGIYGTNNATYSNAYGVWGNVTGAANTGAGVIGTNSAYTGYGIYGLNSAATGGGRGVVGESRSPDGTGVYGYASAISGTTNGVLGTAASPDGYGVYGENTGGGHGLYTPDSAYVGKDFIAPNNKWGGDVVTKDCPEVGICTCDDGTFIVAIVSRGAQLICRQI